MSNKTNILTGIAVIGVPVTAYLCGRSMLEIDRLKRGGVTPTRKEYIISYVPAIISGVITSGCIIANQKLNTDEIIKLSSAVGISAATLNKYKSKLKTIIGEKTERQISESILIHQDPEFHEINLNTPDVKRTWVEDISGKTFEKYEREIIDAEYHINRMFSFNGMISLEEYFNFFGIESEEEEKDKYQGWTINDGYSFIDFLHYEDQDGLAHIRCVFDPEADFME